MMKKFLNERGFSLVQAMIFAAIMASGALVMTRTITDLKLAQKGAETRDDLETFHATIVSTLQESAHCKATHLWNTSNTPKQIRLSGGDVIAEENQTYMNGNIRVDTITTVASPSPGGSISIRYSRLKGNEKLKQGFGGKDILKTMPVNFITVGGVFDRCYLDESLYNSLTAQEFCVSLGSFMQWDAVTKKCTLQSHSCTSVSGTVFAGIDSNGNEICQRITDAVVTKDMFGIGNVNCPARNNLGLTVIGNQIVIACNPGGSGCVSDCPTLEPTYCPADPPLTDVCGTTCGIGTKSSGCASTLSWSPLTKDFGTIIVGNNSTDQTFTLTNSAGVPTTGCTAPTITDTTNFTLTPSGNCVGTANLAASGSCTVTIRANPTTAGGKTTTLTRTCATGGSASTTANQIVVNNTGGGLCQGTGLDSANLFAIGAPDTGTCAGQYRYQYLDVNPANFAVGNIYSITQGPTVSEEAVLGDTPTTMLNRLSARINAANIVSTGACGTSALFTTVSGNRMTYRVQWQHSTVPSGSRTCKIATQAACVATTDCTWNTTGPSICTGGTGYNFTVPQGTCNGTYNVTACAWNGTGTGSDTGCYYGYPSSGACNAVTATVGCYWGSVSQSCYGTDSASCTSLGGSCSWTAYPSQHRSCTTPWLDQTACTAQSPTCTWTPI